MERLTMTSNKGGVAFTFDLDINCKPSEAQKILKLAQKLKEYEDAEEKGLLFKLPCKPGDSVFIVITKTGEIKEHKVSKIILGKTHDQIVFVGGKCFTMWGKDWNEHLCKYVHFTKEAAEQALKQIQEETNNE